MRPKAQYELHPHPEIGRVHDIKLKGHMVETELTSGVVSQTLNLSTSIVYSSRLAADSLFCLFALICSFWKVGTGRRFWNKKSSRMSALNCK